MTTIFVVVRQGHLDEIDTYFTKSAAQRHAAYFATQGFTCEIYEGDVANAPFEVHEPARPPQYEGG